VIDELEAALYGRSRTELSHAEVAMLESAGVDLDERPDDPDPMLHYVTEFAAIRATSLTPTAFRTGSGCAADSRAADDPRQEPLCDADRRTPAHPRLPACRTLAGPQRRPAEPDDGGPRPVSVQRWITAADPALEGMTPLDWLKAGRDVDAVLEVGPAR
jgi:hypothetical protein